ncbi:hypothetical protein ASC61_12210 [Aeromicrobium sp. Root344]|uniref:cytochrome P450 n=1 Tax=Aeromicrobium sp. Root344 TaxID=1736521 RepID=UPI000700736D|nr:cytochrome P450 [Aeromicrobium sp. Root344]KQV75704.1 hypothetical protein ASC61_12210 [Aeromicrobium sp. Root344]
MAASTALASRALAFGPDKSLALLRDGYQFWQNLRDQRGSDVVRARLLHERATCIRGGDAARFFYEEPRLERSSALPAPIVGTLFGHGAVHTLDADQHVHRKSLFTDLLTAEAVGAIAAEVGRRWDERAPTWRGETELFEEASAILLGAVGAWLGLPIHAEDAAGRAADMLAMVDGFGSPGARHWRGHRARGRTEHWMEGVLQDIRDGGSHEAPIGTVALFRDGGGELLPVHTAAVEAINLVRPTVAISWLLSGVALAFDSWPHLREDLASGTISALDLAQEVRRCYPVAPFLAARATEDLEWSGEPIPAGSLVVLDLWGTDHDPRIWPDPFRFDPTRFQQTPVTPFNLVPQGGGDRNRGHRCPGEDVTLAVLITLIPRVAGLSYAVVGERPGLRRMPPRPTCRIDVRSA